MNTYKKIILGAALPAFWAAGCSDFLKGGMLTTNPNQPTLGSASMPQLFASIQANNWAYQTADIARVSSMMTQQLVGVSRQMLSAYNYSGLTESAFGAAWGSPYGGGGLNDLRQLEALATAGSDLKMLGIAQILEAWMIGTLADVYGDVPYNEANDLTAFPNPALDPQAEVYDSVQSKLTQGIANINANVVGTGPGATDLVYAGNNAKWIALAHTLKARFYMHEAEALGNAMYTNALAEAALGIQSNAGDYTANTSGSIQLESNMWWQFMILARCCDLVASDSVAGAGGTTVRSVLWDMLIGMNDPRFAEYFNPAADADVSTVRVAKGFHQPLVTYNENALIQAEANVALGNSGLAALNAEQTSWATATTWHTARAVAVTGTATLNDVMTEKYITLFQSPEVWNDYKRTCLPALSVVSPLSQFRNDIPSRLYYDINERNANTSIPVPGTAPNGAFNWNDPNPCHGAP